MTRHPQNRRDVGDLRAVFIDAQIRVRSVRA
jgi:hypothetical protein